MVQRIERGNIFVDLGKKHVNWGAAYAWNQVNIFEETNRFLKEDNNFRNMAFLQYFWDRSISLSGVYFLDQPDFGLKGLWSQNNLDANLYYLYKDRQSRFGLDFSAVTAENIEFHGELLSRQGASLTYPVNPTTNVYTWEPVKMGKEFFIETIVGGQYTAADGLQAMVEYLHTPLGFSQEEMARIKQGAQASYAGNRYFFYEANRRYDFARFGQNYLFGRVFKPDIFSKCDLELVSYLSLADGGAMVMPNALYRINDNATLTAKIYLPVGSSDSEFRFFFNGFGLVSVSYFF